MERWAASEEKDLVCRKNQDPQLSPVRLSRQVRADHAILPSTSAKFAIAVECPRNYSRDGKDCNEGIELHRWLIECDIAGKIIGIRVYM